MNSCRIARSSSRPETSRKMQTFWYCIVTACYWFKVSRAKKKNIWLTKIKTTKKWLQMFSHDLWSWNWIWNPRACNQPLLLMSMQLSSEYTPEYNRDGLDSTCIPMGRDCFNLRLTKIGGEIRNFENNHRLQPHGCHWNLHCITANNTIGSKRLVQVFTTDSSQAFANLTRVPNKMRKSALPFIINGKPHRFS